MRPLIPKPAPRHRPRRRSAQPLKTASCREDRGLGVNERGDAAQPALEQGVGLLARAGRAVRDDAKERVVATTKVIGRGQWADKGNAALVGQRQPAAATVLAIGPLTNPTPTWWSSPRRRGASSPFCSSSRGINSSRRPAIPPAALMSSTASCVPLCPPMLKSEMRPLSPPRKPMRSGCRAPQSAASYKAPAADADARLSRWRRSGCGTGRSRALSLAVGWLESMSKFEIRRKTVSVG